MAQQPQPQYEFHYQRVELLKTEELGVGSYGAVCKAMCDDLLCAAKILHRTLFQFTAPGTTTIMRKFEQECRVLSAIKHPHIVQYLGTYHDPESRLPVLLMELMDESLTQFLKRSRKPLPYHIEVNLCHDIVLALSYLHSNSIIHRDLSSNNVLLIAGSRAKVTDFGMVKLYDVNRSKALTPLTLCPGTTVYMSPEALGEPPVYTDKLDSFSLGVLCVQIITRQFPDPGNRFKIVEINDPKIPSGTVQVSVPEIERRRSHINLIDSAHPLVPVALDCLKDRDRERPSCHKLCSRISTLKSSPKYTESVQQAQVNTRPTQSANRESREREIQQSQQIQDLQQQLHTLSDKLQQQQKEIRQQQQQILKQQRLQQQLDTQSDKLRQQQKEIRQQQQQILKQRRLLTATEDQLQTLQKQVATKDRQLAGKDHRLQQKEAAIATNQQVIQQLRQQLEKVIAEFQKHLLEREDEKRQLQQQSKQRGGQRQEEMEASCAAASGGSIKLRQRDGRRAPCEEWREGAADVTVAEQCPSETLHKDMYHSTVKHISMVTDAYGYVDINYTYGSVPEPEEGKNPSTVKHTPVTEDPDYHNVELPEQSASNKEENATAVKHTPIVTDAHSNCNIEELKLSLPEENEDLSTAKHSPVVADARGYCKVDAPELSPSEESVSLSTVKHNSIVTDARGFDVAKVQEVKGKTLPSRPPRNFPPKPPPYYKGELSPTSGSSVPPPLPKHHPIVTLPRTKGKQRDIGQLHATVTKLKKESKAPCSDQTPPAVPAKPQARDQSPGIAEGSSTGVQATEDIVIVPVDRHPGQECGESPSSEMKHLISVGREEYPVVNLKPKSKKKVPSEDDSRLQLDSIADSSTKVHKQLDQEQANEAEILLKAVKSKVPPPRPPWNLPPKPPPYQKVDLSPMSESSVPPPLPIKRNRSKASLTDRSTSTTTLEGNHKM